MPAGCLILVLTVFLVSPVLAVGASLLAIRGSENDMSGTCATA